MRDSRLDAMLRSVIGVERFLQRVQEGAGPDNPRFPPFNVEKVSENNYRIVMAVAGFSIDEIEITSESSTLKVSGSKKRVDTEISYIHRGIAERNFEQSFQLAEHVRVESAKCQNGLLIIECIRHIPDEAKPRKIEILSQ